MATITVKELVEAKDEQKPKRSERPRCPKCGEPLHVYNRFTGTTHKWYATCFGCGHARWLDG